MGDIMDHIMAIFVADGPKMAPLIWGYYGPYYGHVDVVHLGCKKPVPVLGPPNMGTSLAILWP